MDSKGGKWWGGGGGGVMNWESGIDMYTLTCIKLMTSKNLLYKKVNKIQKLKKNKLVILFSNCLAIIKMPIFHPLLFSFSLPTFGQCCPPLSVIYTVSSTGAAPPSCCT